MKRNLFMLMGLLIGILPVLGQSTLNPDTVLPISLPQAGQVADISNWPPILNGQSGFFWTRLGTEEAVQALSELPILQKEINDIIDAGSKVAKQADDTLFWNRVLSIAVVVLPILAIIADEAYHGTHR